MARKYRNARRGSAGRHFTVLPLWLAPLWLVAAAVEVHSQPARTALFLTAVVAAFAAFAAFLQEDGRIVRTGGVELASELEEKGYAGVRA